MPRSTTLAASPGSNGVERVLTKRTVAQQARFACQPCKARRLAAGLQDQLLERRNTFERRPALQRHIFKLAAVIERHYAQFRPFAATGGDPVQMVGWEQACRYANACGALVVSRHGCAPAMPSKIELDDYLARAALVPRPDLDPRSSSWLR